MGQGVPRPVSWKKTKNIFLQELSERDYTISASSGPFCCRISFVPLIEEGGFIPTIDHTIPPDVFLEIFMYYMKRKQDLLAGRL